MDNVPAHLRAELTFPPGVDRNDLAVADEAGQVIAETSWRPTGGPGVASWDQELAELGYVRTTQWTPTEGGFRATVQPTEGKHTMTTHLSENDQRVWTAFDEFDYAADALSVTELSVTVTERTGVPLALRHQDGKTDVVVRPDVTDAQLGAVFRILFADLSIMDRRDGDPPGDWAFLVGDHDGSVRGVGTIPTDGD